jgi:CDP-diacylglycerol--serine O-phosphatidyltransferase
MLYAWCLNHFGKAGWLAVFLYFSCVALRLARFNIQSRTVEKNRFQGLPSPAAAGLIAGFVLVKPQFLIETRYDMIYMLFLPYLLAILMVSNIPYRNFKDIDFKKKFSFSVLLTIVILIIIIAYHPIYTILVAFTVYFASGMLESAYRMISKKRTLSSKASENDLSENREGS